MAAMVTEGTLPFQVALSHLLYNAAGILVFYPIPITRLPVSAARWFGKITRIWRGFPILYIIIAFFVFPFLMLGLSIMFQQGSKGMNVLGAFFCIVLLLILSWLLYFYKFKNGRERMLAYFAERERRRLTYANLINDLEYLKEKVAILMEENTGTIDEGNEDMEAQNFAKQTNTCESTNVEL
jgi:solute carrier family 34 (sodium-dependent phosphate cotransporter)